jgi:glycerate kinase
MAAMRVLIAFDKFKDSISASRACSAAAAAVVALHGGWSTDECPLSDGGEGFAGILTRAAGGTFKTVAATGPRGERVSAQFGIVRAAEIPEEARILLGSRVPGSGTIAVVEMAAASGLCLLAPAMRDPMRASSAGTGELIGSAASAGVAAILLGVGGSATHDLGLGALEALGLSYWGADRRKLSPLAPFLWPLLRNIEGRVGESIPPIQIACDVDNPLLGRTGALAIYGAQKGLKAEDAPLLEAGSARIAAMACRYFGRPESLVSTPGAGAAGGISFGLMAAAGAQLIPGFQLVASWLNLEERLRAADVVITGEGRFDDSSLNGKGPGAIVARALALGKQVHVFAGEVRLTREIPGLRAHAVTPGGTPIAEALANAEGLLSSSVRQSL